MHFVQGENYLGKVATCKNGLTFERKILQSCPPWIIWGMGMICWQIDPHLTTNLTKPRAILAAKWIYI
jgi:hypothetical protein